MLMALALEKVEKKEVYTKHPAAGLFPALTGDEREKLKEDIRKKGLLESIKAIGSEIVDGWHRFEILQELGRPLEGHIEQLPRGTNPWDYAWSRNFHRRHMDAGQKACAAVMYQHEKDARETQAEETPAPASQPKKRGRPKKTKGGTNSPNPPKGKTAEVLAKMFGVSDKYVKDAKKLNEHDPETFEKVRQGEHSLSKAARNLRVRRGGERPAPKKPDSSTLQVNIAVYEITVGKLLKKFPELEEEFIHCAKHDTIPFIPVSKLLDAVDNGDGGEKEKLLET